MTNTSETFDFIEVFLVGGPLDGEMAYTIVDDDGVPMHAQSTHNVRGHPYRYERKRPDGKFEYTHVRQ